MSSLFMTAEGQELCHERWCSSLSVSEFCVAQSGPNIVERREVFAKSEDSFKCRTHCGFFVSCNCFKSSSAL